MFGFLLQWPTILTLAMFPVLTVMYVKLARSEERDARSEFGDTYANNAADSCPYLFRSLDGSWGSLPQTRLHGSCSRWLAIAAVVGALCAGALPLVWSDVTAAQDTGNPGPKAE